MPWTEAHRSLRVLLADPSEGSRRPWSAVLKGGPRHEVVGGMGQLMDRLRKRPIDLVILGFEGESATDLERLLSAFPKLAVLVVVDSQAAAVAALELGALDTLVRPLDPDTARFAIARALERHRLVRENQALRRALADRPGLPRDDPAVMELHRQLQSAYEDALHALVTALDFRGNELRGHSRRVAEYAVVVAQELKISEPALTSIRWGSFLHDVGKIGVPDAILQKEGELTTDERQTMQKHPEMGFEMLRHLGISDLGLDIVLHHHERWDGSGYPDGLEGEDIPLGARIFTVIDTLDAMTSDRPYRPAMTFEAARQELVRHAGSQFDPKIAATVVAISDQVWEAARERAMATDSRFPEHFEGSIYGSLPLH